MKCNNENYLYRKNAQGDITHILDNAGMVVAKYVYDAWGNHAILDANGNDLASGVGVLNPFRYRSYYYDEETDLYYLQTRYYDPELGRFISQDDVSYLAPDSINGLNLYAYCGNNPVMRTDFLGTNFVDDLGTIADRVYLILKMAIAMIGGMAKTVPNIGSSAKAFAKSLGKFGGNLSKGFAIFSYIMVAVSNIIDGINEGKTVLNIATDIIFDCTAIAVGAEIGAMIGSIIPGAGTVIGAVIGSILGAVYMAFESSPFIQELKQMFYEGINTILTDVGRILNNMGNALDTAGNQFLTWLGGLFV